MFPFSSYFGGNCQSARNLQLEFNQPTITANQLGLASNYATLLNKLQVISYFGCLRHFFCWPSHVVLDINLRNLNTMHGWNCSQDQKFKPSTFCKSAKPCQTQPNNLHNFKNKMFSCKNFLQQSESIIDLFLIKIGIIRYMFYV